MRRHEARLATVAVALAGALFVWFVSVRVFPYHSLNHDEAVYLQQAALLLDGQLSLRPPLDGLFRPWFFVDAGETLYPKYAPVVAAMFALGELVGGYRLALPVIAGGILALTSGVTTEVFDRRTGVLAAVFVLASPLFFIDAAVFLPYAPTTFLNLVFAYAYLRADRQDDVRWAALAGGSIGLAFFARPYTAVLYAAPFVGHALWILWSDGHAAFRRQAITAAIGLAGVGTALGYNAVMTGSLLTFPYEAFAPLDGLGFGTRRILDHEVTYTLSLALRANAEVVRLFAAEWIAGGLLGAGLAIVGMIGTVRRGIRPRQAILAGLVVSVVGGNVFFWGNLNVLGDLDRAGDGLVAVLGPYYHFDLLLPAAAFAARGSLIGLDGVRDLLDRGAPDRTWARGGMVAVLILGTVTLGMATVAAVDDPLERNLEASETYERAYHPFEIHVQNNALVFLPDPYGDWLNHPFQVLRNTPGFDGDVVYALDHRPFDLVDTYPNRTIYRYGFRGPWAPFAGSPEATHLQPVDAVAGETVSLNTTLGIPPGSDAVTVRVATDDGQVYYVASNASGSMAVNIRVGADGVRVAGNLQHVGDNGAPLPVDGREMIRVTTFVDYGPRGGFTYRLDVPVSVNATTVRAITPRTEYCRIARSCGGTATYIPDAAPDGVFIRTSLDAEHNS